MEEIKAGNCKIGIYGGKNPETIPITGTSRIICCGMYHRPIPFGKIADYGRCTHPNAPPYVVGRKNNPKIYFRHRPKWCPIKIIPLSEVRKVLDEKDESQKTTLP
jgi:hypothetical protein